MTDLLRDIIARSNAGAAVAIPSVCSAHPDVLRASIRLAEQRERPLVIEATSNQINQDGGYMGMRPAEFVGYVHALADQVGAARERLVFGGDHLGTQVWRNQPAEAAMAKAEVLVAGYAAAGFSKIHLDCSEGCAGEPSQLDDTKTAERSARLARVAARECDDLLFVVGTEVPPPGGARADEGEDIPPTDPDAARKTLAAHDDALEDLAPHIGALVVQPGVEFSPTAVHPLPMDRDPGLAQAIADRSGVCLEAHSTDYQSDAVFPRLAQLGFAFQKVGPALTFAYRAALYALDGLRAAPGQLEAAMEAEMPRNPAHWQGHYAGDEDALYRMRHFGLADRIRYYWPTEAARAAVADLHAAFSAPIPDAALHLAFPQEVLNAAESLPGSQVQRLIDAHIALALAPNFFEDAA